MTAGVLTPTFHYTDTGRIEGPRPEAGYGYHSVTQAERDKRTSVGGAAPAHDRTHREKLHNQSREFKRNNGLYQGMLGRARQIMVGDGWKLAMRPAKGAPASVKAWCDLVEKAFSVWWKKPDVRGRLSGRRMEQLVADEVLTCGDTGVVLIELERKPTGAEIVAATAGAAPLPKTAPYLQVIEAEQIRGPNGTNRDGVDKDEYGRPTLYHVTPYDPEHGQLKIASSRTYRPEEFLLVGWQDRASSTRPVPPGQASFPNLHRLNDVADSEAASWQIQSRYAVTIESAAGSPAIGYGALEGTPRTNPDLTRDVVVETPLAVQFWAKPGEKITPIDRTAPGRSFGESWAAMVRPLGLPFGLPLELILLDWTKSNYSQTRAVVAICQDTFIGWQTVLEDGFYAPMFAWWLAWAIANKVVPPAPGEYVAEWIKPSFPWINLLEETNAWGERVERSFASFSEAVKSQNRDPDAVRAQQAADDIEAIKTAKAVEEATGVLPPWERYAGKKPPTAAPVAPGEKPDDEGKAPPTPPPAAPPPPKGDLRPMPAVPALPQPMCKEAA